jgi:hypothetical protein
MRRREYRRQEIEDSRENAVEVGGAPWSPFTSLQGDVSPGRRLKCANRKA